MTRISNGKRQFWLLVMGLAVCLTARGQSTDLALPTSPPPSKQLRYDENYAYLRDTSRRTDWLDSIKFIPLNTNGDWYLTPGGEIRERYEYYHNSLWGRGPQDDNGYLLQRYMVHADAHFGDYFRIFTQFKSGLEDGRNGGPRPTDRDDVDLNQAFFDVRVPLAEVDSLIFRAGRQELAYGSARPLSAPQAPHPRLGLDRVKGHFYVSGWRGG